MKVSVIIPAYNSSKTILGTIDAIKKQKNINYVPEIVVVDDGSTDDTFDKLKNIEGIKLFRQKNAGPASARNLGAKISSSDILVFTDSDTLPLENWLYHLTKHFKEPNIVATSGTYGIINNHSKLANLIQEEISFKHSKYSDYIRFGGTYNFAIRKNLFFKIGGFDEAYKNASGEDTDLCYKILNEGYLIRYVPEAIVKHYHPENIIKYIKTQYKHGYWRAKLYYSHPNKITGDDYTGNKEIYETLLSFGLFVFLLLQSSVLLYNKKKTIFLFLFFLDLISFIIVETISIYSISRYKYKMLGLAIFFIRAFVRTIGFACGLITFIR